PGRDIGRCRASQRDRQPDQAVLLLVRRPYGATSDGPLLRDQLLAGLDVGHRRTQRRLGRGELARGNRIGGLRGGELPLRGGVPDLDGLVLHDGLVVRGNGLAELVGRVVEISLLLTELRVELLLLGGWI